MNRQVSPLCQRTALGGTLATEQRALDWLNLCVANIQTGFGPFIAIYLATAGWSQTAIGVALSLGTVTAMASQIPAGALVDAIHAKAKVAGASILLFTASALLFGIMPIRLFIYAAEILHAFSSCMLSPAIAAISLSIVGQGRLGLRLGRNARFASMGVAQGALLMGLCGYYLSARSIFFLVAVLTLPALVALLPLLHATSPAPRQRRNATRTHGAQFRGYIAALADRRLLIFAACLALFTFGNAALLPLVSANLSKSVGDSADLFIAACIILPQIIAAIIAPTVGQVADARGRRLVLVIGLAALPLRGGLFAISTSPPFIALIQGLDGATAACIGVLLPLVASDIAGRSSHYNLVLGFLGFTVGIGGTLSTTVGGMIADRFGDASAYLALGAVGAVALLLALLAMPETRPIAAASGDPH